MLTSKAAQIDEQMMGIFTPFSMISISLTLCVLIYIITQTWQHIYDNIYLRGELLMGCIILSIYMLSAYIWVGIALSSGYNGKYQQVINFCFNTIISFSFFALIVVSTQYVRIQVNKNENRLNNKLSKKRSHGINRENIDKNTWIFSDEVDFEALISTPDGLLAFLDHLGKEYELNNLVVK